MCWPLSARLIEPYNTILNKRASLTNTLRDGGLVKSKILFTTDYNFIIIVQLLQNGEYHAFKLHASDRFYLNSSSNQAHTVTVVSSWHNMKSYF